MSPFPDPLPDRVVLMTLVATVILCFALVFWFVRLNPSPAQQPLQWRQSPTARPPHALI